MHDEWARQIERSWIANAEAWTRAVRGHHIQSREVTDAAMLRAVLDHRPKRVLDGGCGEGWLCRALAAQGVGTVGVDASAPLIAAARAAHGPDYHVLSYTDLAKAQPMLGRFDVIVFNFALLHAESVSWLRGLRAFLNQGGVMVIQTVHPWRAGGPYRDGWRTETFDGFGTDFAEAMPWFYRTLQSWVESLLASGWEIEALQEPIQPQTGQPVSLLITASSR